MLNELAKEQHLRMVEKGFYDNPPELGTSLMLIVSELSEALEAARKGHYASLDGYKRSPEDFLEKIKDTFEDEIADTIIRLLDLCGFLDIDIDTFVKEKCGIILPDPLGMVNNFKTKSIPTNLGWVYFLIYKKHEKVKITCIITSSICRSETP